MTTQRRNASAPWFPLLVTVAALGACSDDPVDIARPTVQDRASAIHSAGGGPAETAWVQGCARFDVKLSGRTAIDVEAVEPDPDCGELALVLDSAVFDRPTGTLEITVRIEHQGTGDIESPLVAAGPSDLSVIAPRGFHRAAGPRDRLAFARWDSVADPDDPRVPSAYLWKVEELGAVNGAPGAVFGPVALGLLAHDGVREFRLILHAVARRVPTIEVPEVAPDTVPSDLRANLDPTWQAPTHAFGVGFEPGLTVTEKSRLAAAAGATTVLGGVPLHPAASIDGIYILEVDSDGTMGPVTAAVDAMGAQAGVVGAFPLLTVTGSFRIPGDGARWTDWRVRPDSADGSNWGHEAVAAPLAWGCATGSPDIRIGVVDGDFSPVVDLRPNLVRSVTSSTPDSQFHGTMVASIIGARGNNGKGISGMMWEVGLAMHEYNVQAGAIERVIQAVTGALGSGADIVNLSGGIEWGPHGLNRRPGTAADSAIIRAAYELFRDFLGRSLDHADGVLVVAAGNDALDARWSAFPLLVEDYPDRVVVVAATEPPQARPEATLDLGAFSNFGDLVDVAAPGRDIEGLSRDTSYNVVGWGTSLAAPFVTGTLGLMKSFDPSLRGSDLKALLLEGARNDGRSVVGPGGPYHFLNAYEAIKAVAQRRGAPLCGNLLTTHGFELRAARSDGWETLFTLPGNRGELNVLHGGRVIDAWLENSDTGESTQLWLELRNGTWEMTGSAPSRLDWGVEDGGFYNSHVGVSHEPDTVARVEFRPVPGHWQIALRDARGPGYWQLLETIAFDEPPNPPTNHVCVRWREYEDPWTGEPRTRCFKTVDFNPGTHRHMRVSWVPQSGKVILWVRRGERTQGMTGTVACGPPGAGVQCYTWATQTVWNATDVYEVDFRTGDRQLLWTIPYSIEELGVSEDGQTIALTRTVTTDEDRAVGWHESGSTWVPTRESSTVSERCAVELRAYGSGQVLLSGPETSCREFYFPSLDGFWRIPELAMGP